MKKVNHNIYLKLAIGLYSLAYKEDQEDQFDAVSTFSILLPGLFCMNLLSVSVLLLDLVGIPREMLIGGKLIFFAVLVIAITLHSLMVFLLGIRKRVERDYLELSPSNLKNYMRLLAFYMGGTVGLHFLVILIGVLIG